MGIILGDNTYDDSGYRFHDAYSISPTQPSLVGHRWPESKIFKRKRKSDCNIDAVEDGGRAIVIEEAIAAFMFAYARQHNFLEAVNNLDFYTLKTFQILTADLEVSARQLWEVEDAVLQGFAAWRQLRQNERWCLATCAT